MELKDVPDGPHSLVRMCSVVTFLHRVSFKSIILKGLIDISKLKKHKQTKVLQLHTDF